MDGSGLAPVLPALPDEVVVVNATHTKGTFVNFCLARPSPVGCRHFFEVFIFYG